MKTKTQPNFRKMSLEDYNTVVRNWMILEGWNPGLYDGTVYFAGAEENTLFYVLEDNDNKKIIASIMIYMYNSELSVLGTYIVDPSYRGRGYGKYLFDSAIKMAEESGIKNIMLFSVPAQINTYAKSGFVPTGKTLRWEKNIDRLPTSTVSTDYSDVHQVLPEYAELEGDFFNDIAKYDEKNFHANRKLLLGALLTLANSFFMFATDPYNTAEITGIAVMRPTEMGYRIGPVYADNINVAIDLFLSLFHKITLTDDKPVKIIFDSNGKNIQANQLAENYFQFKFNHVDSIDCTEMIRQTIKTEINEPTVEITAIDCCEYAKLSLEIG